MAIQLIFLVEPNKKVIGRFYQIISHFAPPSKLGQEIRMYRTGMRFRKEIVRTIPVYSVLLFQCCIIGENIHPGTCHIVILETLTFDIYGARKKDLQ